MAFTLATARTSLREDILRDPDSRGWTDAVLDRHLEIAHRRVIGRHIANGGNTFRKQASLTSSNGDLDVSSYDLRRISGLQHTRGGVREKVGFVKSGEGVRKSTVNDSFILFYDEMPTFPATDGDALVDSPSTFAELEDLILMRAAQRAAVYDRELPMGLGDMIRELEDECDKQRSYVRMHRPARPESLLYEYTINRAAQTVELFERLK